MEVIQGKKTDQKVIIAQEIAFAKILAGNNKTLRDRALKKLKRWLNVRGNGKWAFEENEFIRISTGLFYCMWMSDKYLVQEELAESISQLIHCFEKNSEGALLFIKCFFKRLLMEWEGLDQYRIDKFNMLVRRFLRQSLVYCKKKQWDESVVSELMKIFYQVVLHKDNCLGFILHFISIYAEEIAKVSKGKLRQETVTALIEPIVKLMSKSKDQRIQQEISYFFDHIIRQTDVGLEFEDRFNAWKQQGFPGTGPECMKREIVSKGKRVPVENGNDEDFEHDDDEDDDDDERLDEALDPRAGSVDVFLPQIPIDPDALIALFKKYENTPQTIPIGKKKLRTWIHKLYAIKKGRFPAKIKKDLILEEKNKRRSALKMAKNLLEYTESLYDGPVRTKELQAISKALEDEEEEVDENEEMEELDEDEEMNVEEEEEEDEDENIEEEEEDEEDEGVEEEEDEYESVEEEEEEEEDDEDEEEDLEEVEKSKSQVDNKIKPGNKKEVKDSKVSEQVSLETKKKTKKQNVKDNKIKCIINPYAEEAVAKMKEEGKPLPDDILSHMKENKKQLQRAMKNHEKLMREKIAEEVDKELKKATREMKTVVNEDVEPKKKRVKLIQISKGKVRDEGGKGLSGDVAEKSDSSQMATPAKRRKILSSWQVQELDTSSPDYYKIKTPKTIKLEKKTGEDWDTEENQEPDETKDNSEDVELEVESKGKEEFTPVFWEKAKAKASKKLGKFKNKDIVLNPYALLNNESKSPGLRRISFALDRNMAQENDEYLEEVRNSPKVPFDGSKKPSQGVLKSGLSPSPVNPFYRFKRIKF